MKQGRTSSFKRLAEYITSDFGKAERIGNVHVANCQNNDLDWATTEVLAIQEKNQRAENDKTYHLLISFAPGEVPALDVLRDIEARVCAAIGFGEHQRVSAIHNDTDSLHIHVAINKIHPERLTIHEPYRDYHTLGQICEKLEIEHGLTRTNHAGKKRGSENHAQDMERMAGVESLLGFVKRECLPQLQASQTWGEIHQVLRAHGLTMQVQANGLVVKGPENLAVKASSIARELSKPKLEARLGEFIPAQGMPKTPQTTPQQSPAPSDAEPSQSATDRLAPKTPAAQPQAVPAVQPKSLNELTDPRQIVTIFRGEGEGNEANGTWWTFDRDKAQRFADANKGSVREVHIKAGDLARIAAVGHHGSDELVVDAARLVNLAVDKDALERARKACSKPSVAKVGTKPPPTSRGRHRSVGQLSHMHIASGPLVDAIEKARAQANSKTPVAKVGTQPPPSRRGRQRRIDQLEQLEIESARRYDARPMKSRVDTTELYSFYKSEQAGLYSSRKKEWDAARATKDSRIEAVKRSGRLKRAATKLLGESGPQKRLIYALTSKALRADIQKINEEYMQERQRILDKYERLTWADWLQREARKGNSEALEALRAREARSNGKRNGMRATGPKVNASAPAPTPDTITKNGTVIYRVGASAIRDDGAELKVSTDARNDAVEAALRMAMERYGSRITVNGTAAFKAQIVQVAAAAKLSLTFDDPELESRRQAFVRSTNPERKHERHNGRRHRSSPGAERARSIIASAGLNTGYAAAGRAATAAQRAAAASTHAGVRAANAQEAPARGHDRSGRAKPNVAAVGKHPPPPNQNRLRKLSELGLVRIGQGAEVLLPRDVPHNVEQQGAEQHGQLRRVVDRPGRGITPADKAAEKYIAEREAKRSKGFDIKKHKLYNRRDEGPVLFAGTRLIEGQHLALLDRGQDIEVLPVDESSARSLKRLKLGDAVSITPDGAIATGASKKRGRTR
jgi:hypothetical protein